MWRPRLKSSDGPWYLAIVEALEDDIASGKLAVDTRLPTQRELSEKLELSVGTVTRAYVEAEKRGLIRSEGRRGTFVGESKERSASFSNPFETESDLIDLSRYQPAPSEDPDLLATLRRLSRRPQTQWMLQYTPTAGLAHHREAGARWLKKLGVEAEPDSIVETVGAQHAISAILSATTQKGDVVLSESHTYPGLKPTVEVLGLKLVGVPADEDGLIPEEFDAACTKKKARALYCNPTINNPTTSTIPAGRREQIAAIAQKHGVFIVEDEANRGFVSSPPPTITEFAPDRCFLVATASKVIAAGLRVCFVKPPPDFVNPLRDVVFASIHNPSPLSFEIFAHWVDDGTVDDTIARRRRSTQARQELAREILGEYAPPAPPTSSFTWLPLPDGWLATHFTAAARTMGVLVLAAQEFAVDTSPSPEAVRICVGGTTSRQRLATALTNLVDILKSPAKSGQITI